MTLIYPIAVVPGIIANYLCDECQLPPELVWGMLEKDYDRVALHPENLRCEAREPARVMPDHVLRSPMRNWWRSSDTT
jgi:hypothetical protein